jgi:hypothetical protein
MEHDSPTLSFNLARDSPMPAKAIGPGALILAKMIGTARKDAGDLASDKVAHLPTDQVRALPELWES